MKNFNYLIILLIILLSGSSFVSADDNEIFGTGKKVEPNILIIMDTSGSMSNEVTLVSDCWEVCSEWKCDGDWDCEKYTDKCVKWSWWTGSCIKWEKVCEKQVCNGSLTCINYEEQCDTTVSTRMAVAKETIKNIIDNYGTDNRFGIMRFDGTSSYNGGYIPSYGGKYVTCSVKDSFIYDAEGNLKTGSDYETGIANYKVFLKNVVDSLNAGGSTPLAESLFEAGRYFSQEASLFNTGTSTYPVSGTYSEDPIEHWCRNNYIILMTDGEPQLDHSIAGQTINSISLGTSKNYPATDGGDYRYFYDDGTYYPNKPELHDVSALLYENDLRTDLVGKQNITTYTIGFAEGVSEKAQQLLQDTADRGIGEGNTPYVDDGGLFFFATNEKDLAEAFVTIMFNIDEQTTSFTVPSIPVSDLNKAYSGDYAYMAMFQPVAGQSRWIGNLKKYKLNSKNNLASCNDSETEILDDTGQIRNSAISCWSDTADGASIDKGGAGGELSATSDSIRKIYSNIDADDKVLSNSVNAFSKANTSLTPEHFGLSDEGAKDHLIDNIRMVDETWKLGDLNHSQPIVVKYKQTDGTYSSYIFVGSNDGMLHCFDDSDGSEKWAFVPKEQFTRLEQVYTGEHSYFIDGSPAVAELEDKKILIFGERRGGNNYYALDITDINSPKYLYTYLTQGQTWKQPQYVKIEGPSSVQECFLITGGYDANYDLSDTVTDSAGSSVELIDVETGALVKRYDDTDISIMTDSIINAYGVDVVDDGKDNISQIYASDLEGRLFGFRDNPVNSKVLDSEFQIKNHIFTASGGKKIFEESDFVTEYMQYWDSGASEWKFTVGDYIYFGTGDRANPLRSDLTNYFYCVKNDWITEGIDTSKQVKDFTTLDSSPLASDSTDTDYVMIDVTDNTIQDGTEEEKLAMIQALNDSYNRGWYIELEHPGEKVLSAPTVYDGVVYFTTFTPSSGVVASDPCTADAGGGTSRLYAVDYKTGAAVYDTFYEETDEEGNEVLNKKDRFKEISAGLISISPSPEIIITDKGVKLLVGPETDDIKSKKSGMNIFYIKQQ
jgi:type IV pilus assembly protein PilY1